MSCTPPKVAKAEKRKKMLAEANEIVTREDKPTDWIDQLCAKYGVSRRTFYQWYEPRTGYQERRKTA